MVVYRHPLPTPPVPAFSTLSLPSVCAFSFSCYLFALCQKASIWNPESLRRESTVRLNGPRKKPKTTYFKKALPLLSPRRPLSYVSFFVVYKLVFFLVFAQSLIISSLMKSEGRERGRDEKHQLESMMKRQNRRWFRKEISSLTTASRGCMRKWLRSSWKHR